jgi:hypothetical protein
LITARCHPALKKLLPPPVPASRGLPGWLKKMPSEVESGTLGGATIRTLKHCPPFIDALSLGVLIPLPCDLTIQDGEISWDWDFPTITDSPITRAPIGVHVPEQAQGMPLDLKGQIVIKFTNYWTLEAPKGWDLLFTHPLNRADLPFQTLSGVVSGDRFTHGYVHFPSLWTDCGFEGVLPRGTPVAQVIPTPRVQPELSVVEMQPADIDESRAVQEALQAEPGVYRKIYRA